MSIYAFYNTDLFNQSTIERMSVHYEKLLAAAASDPSRRIADLPLLTEAERHLFRIEWNDTSRARTRRTAVFTNFSRTR